MGRKLVENYKKLQLEVNMKKTERMCIKRAQQKHK